MANKTNEKITKKVNILFDVKVEADMSGMLWRSNYYYYKNPEEHAKDLERAVREFVDFLRDHRSQDMISLDVQRVYQDVCSICKEQWEIGIWDDEKWHCENCGAIVETE
jgi:hypothetical protein